MITRFDSTLLKPLSTTCQQCRLDSIVVTASYY